MCLPDRRRPPRGDNRKAVNELRIPAAACPTAAGAIVPLTAGIMSLGGNTSAARHWTVVT